MRHDINRKIEKIKKEYEAGASIMELSKKYGTSYSTMRNKLMKYYSYDEFEKINRKQNLKKQIIRSKKKTTTGYFRVKKEKNESCMQGFIYVYSYYDNGQRKRISRTSLYELKIAVFERRLPWIEF